MSDSIELAYRLSAKERAEVPALLHRLFLRRKDWSLYIHTSPGLILAFEVLLGYMLVSWLVRDWPTLAARDWTEVPPLSHLLGYLFALGIAWHLAYRIWLFAGRYWGLEKAYRAGRDGVNWGEHHVNATPKALTIRLAAHSRVYRWAAFSELRKTRKMLLLMTTPRTAVAIPRRAFGSKADELAFCDFVKRQIGNG